VVANAFAETKDLIAGWIVIDVESYERALELAGELSAAPGASGKPIHEWLEVRPFLSAPPTITDGRTVDEALVRTLTPTVIGILVRRGADFAAAEDAVQETLVEAVRVWPTTRGGTPRAGWSLWPGVSSSTPPAPLPPDGTARYASRASPCPARARWTTRSSCTSCAPTRP
jgi:hypothetical protein